MIITRFAPSPTGLLHLGSARTALFNWLYARHYGGSFLLRLEDTDQARSSPVFADHMQKSLHWLGLHWDGAVVVQSQRQERHYEIVQQLLAQGKAYRCYCTPKELADMRDEALRQGRAFLYDRRWRDRPESEGMGRGAPVIRLKAPLRGATVLDDGVQGLVTVANETLDDMVLLRSDGTPTYMLAVVVDDHDMNITHIIRGDDHLTNAFRQLQLYEALGWTPPRMMHIPLIHGADGTKLSKRHGDLNVLAYRDKGILPEAMLNALMRLGWAHGNDEIISLDQAIRWFDGTGLSRAPARFDEQKVLALNAHYIRQYTQKTLFALLKKEYGPIEKGGVTDSVFWDEVESKALYILPELQKRAKTLQDVWQSLRIYIHPVLSERPHLPPEDQHLLEMFLPDLIAFYENVRCVTNHPAPDIAPPLPQDLEDFLRTWTQRQNLPFAKLIKPLRLALTGSTVSPGITDVMRALGPMWVCERIQSIL